MMETLCICSILASYHKYCLSLHPWITYRSPLHTPWYVLFIWHVPLSVWTPTSMNWSPHQPYSFIDGTCHWNMFVLKFSSSPSPPIVPRFLEQILSTRHRFPHQVLCTKSIQKFQTSLEPQGVRIHSRFYFMRSDRHVYGTNFLIKYM